MSLKKGVIISSVVAANPAWVTVGDRLTLDDHTFKVADHWKNYVSHFIYIDQQVTKNLRKDSANSYLLKLKILHTRQVQAVSRGYDESAAVKAVSQNASMISLIQLQILGHYYDDSSSRIDLASHRDLV